MKKHQITYNRRDGSPWHDEYDTLDELIAGLQWIKLNSGDPTCIDTETIEVNPFKYYELNTNII